MSEAPSRARTVFLGSGSFALPVLTALASAPEVSVVGVVTAPPRPAGRGGTVRRSPVAERADDLGLGPVLEPPRLRARPAIDEVLALDPALIVLADYGQIVPAALLDAPAHGALNLHPSLLPRHRGASPVPAAILAGDRQTGVTLMRMDERLDGGPIVAQVGVPLEGTETAPELEARLADEAARLLRATLADWLSGRLRARLQPEAGATMTKPLRREDGRLDPARTAADLTRRVRAYQPWPGTWAETIEGRLIVWRARPLTVAGPRAEPGRSGARADAGTGVEWAASSIRSDRGEDARALASAAGSVDGDAGPARRDAHAADGEPLGRFVPDGDGLAILVADGWLRLDEVQLGGSRRMTSAELRRGHPRLVGSRLGHPALP